MNQPTPYSELNAVLGNLVSNVRRALGDTFVVCLHVIDYM